MTSPIYHFWAEASGARVRVRYNGYPLFVADSDQPRQKAEDVSLWTRPGTNKLVVDVALPSQGDGAPSFKAQLKRADRSNTDAVELLWDIDWPPLGTGIPVPIFDTVELELESPSLFWDEAEELSIDPVAQAELVAYGTKLHTLFAAGDHAALSAEMAYRGRDIGRVLEMAEADAASRQAGFFKTIMTGKDFEARPLDPAGPSIGALSGGLVVWLRNGNQPLLLSERGQGTDVYVARVGGQWTVVR